MADESNRAPRRRPVDMLFGEIVQLKPDAPEADTREWISSRPGQMALLLQISMTDYDEADAAGGQRVQRLAAEVRVQLNRFLTENGISPVRRVVVQDLVFSKT